LDRALRIASGVLGLIVAVPVILAVFFIFALAWLYGDNSLLMLAIPLGVLAMLQTTLAIFALVPRRATFLALTLLGAVELIVGTVLLLVPTDGYEGTAGAIVVYLIAAAVALFTAVRLYLCGGRPGPPMVGSVRRAGSISVTVRKPGAPH